MFVDIPKDIDMQYQKLYITVEKHTLVLPYILKFYNFEIHTLGPRFPHHPGHRSIPSKNVIDPKIVEVLSNTQIIECFWWENDLF